MSALGRFHCNEINRLRERLRVTYEDHKASFEKLLEMDNSVLVHYKNLKYLTIELFKFFNASLQI